jgi:purine-binding chemotaxis protein CheW
MEAVVETANTSEPAVTRGEWTAQGGKFLTFLLGDEDYGVEILKVRELLGIQDITVVPHTREYMRGVINLRGKVIPVIDLRIRFGLPPIQYNDQTCIVVVDVGTLMGIIVDTVREVHDIPATDIQPPPRLDSSVDAAFILGMGKINDDVKILLDIGRVLNGDELVEVPSDTDD